MSYFYCIFVLYTNIMTTTHTNEELYPNGVYRIYNILTKQSYIGSAAGIKSKSLKKRGFYRRFIEHTYNLKNNKHRNKYLQNSYNKYGSKFFIFEILEYCKPEECSELEISYMTKYKSMIYEEGYNIIKQPLSNAHYTFTEIHKTKISNTLTGSKRPLDIVKKWSNCVIQYDLNLNYINEYYSMAEASRITGVQRQDIGQVCLGNGKSAGGFIWKKKDEDIV